MGQGPEKPWVAEEWRKRSRTLMFLRKVDVSDGVAITSEEQAPSRRGEGQIGKLRTVWVQRGRECIRCRQAGNGGKASWRGVV